MRTKAIAGALAVVAALVVAGAGLAGKPSSSFELVVLSSGDVRATAGTAPSYEGLVTFDVATTSTDRPFVNVRCYQGGAWVYDGWHGFFDGYYTEPVFTLASDYWAGGAADCSARLVEWGKNARERTLATLEFHVDA
jgi:hypothetical protein